MNDISLFDYTESLCEFEEELNKTIDDADLDILNQQLNELDEQEVKFNLTVIVWYSYKRLFEMLVFLKLNENFLKA